MYIYIDGWMDGVCYRVRTAIAIDVNRRPRFGRPIISPPRRQWHCISILDGRPAATRQRPSKKKKRRENAKRRRTRRCYRSQTQPPLPPPATPSHPTSTPSPQSNCQSIQSRNTIVVIHSAIFVDISRYGGCRWRFV